MYFQVIECFDSAEGIMDVLSRQPVQRKCSDSCVYWCTLLCSAYQRGGIGTGCHQGSAVMFLVQEVNPLLGLFDDCICTG